MIQNTEPSEVEETITVTTSDNLSHMVGSGDSVTVPEGYVMRYTLEKMLVTKEMVLDRLLELDPYSCRAADLRDVQSLARIVIGGSDEVTEQL